MGKVLGGAKCQCPSSVAQPLGTASHFGGSFRQSRPIIMLCILDSPNLSLMKYVFILFGLIILPAAAWAQSLCNNESACNYAPGYFTPGESQLILDAGEGAYTIASGDIQGDGVEELVVTTSISAQILSPSNEGFEAIGYIGTSQILSSAIGDVTGDGLADVVVARFGSPASNSDIRYYPAVENEGSVNFYGSNLIANVSSPQDVTLGDVDGDGDLDVIACSQQQNWIGVSLNDGQGSFGEMVLSYAVQAPWEIDVIDNGYGGVKLLAISWNTPFVGYSSFNSNEAAFSYFTELQMPAGFAPGTGSYTGKDVEVGDLNGDNVPDVIASFNGGIVFYPGANNGFSNYLLPGEILTTTVGGHKLQIGDVDFDGDNDLVQVRGDKCYYLKNNQGTATFSSFEYQIGPLGENYYDVSLFDYDGDGDSEVALCDLGTDLYTWHENSNECLFGIEGCTDPSACNFNPEAGCDDGSCNVSGCTDEEACNFDPGVSCDDGSCSYPGCTNPLACNFDALAGCDDGLCISCEVLANLCGPGTLWDDTAQQCIVTNPSDSNFDGCVQLSDLLDLLASYGLCGE